MRFLFVIISFDLIMSSSNDYANREQHFARLEVQMYDM